MVIFHMSNIGQRIRQAREEAVMTQEELAKKAGITRHSLSVIETGKTVPRVSTIRKIAAALGADPRELRRSSPSTSTD